jgi:hypothetical protein
MNKQYTSVTKGHTPRPRSERMRREGVGNLSSTVVLNASANGTGISGDGHKHVNLDALDQITTDSSGYLWLDLLKEITTEVDGQETTVFEKNPRKGQGGLCRRSG